MTLFYQLNTLCHVTGCEINLIAAKKYFSKTIALLLKFFIVFSVAFFAKDVTIKRSCHQLDCRKEVFFKYCSLRSFSLVLQKVRQIKDYAIKLIAVPRYLSPFCTFHTINMFDIKIFFLRKAIGTNDWCTLMVFRLELVC